MHFACLLHGPRCFTCRTNIFLGLIVRSVLWSRFNLQTPRRQHRLDLKGYSCKLPFENLITFKWLQTWFSLLPTNLQALIPSLIVLFLDYLTQSPSQIFLSLMLTNLHLLHLLLIFKSHFLSFESATLVIKYSIFRNQHHFQLLLSDLEVLLSFNPAQWWLCLSSRELYLRDLVAP